MFKAGLIGCGNIGAKYDENKTGNGIYTHAGMYGATQGIELVCAADPDPIRRQSFQNFWQIPSMYDSHLEMLAAETPDIISIATPDHTHEKIIRDVLDVNPPRLIFTEKPVANSVKSAERIDRACREKGTTLVVDYIRRWDERHQELRKFIRKGNLGEIQGVTGYYVRGIRHNGCQIINLLQFFFDHITSVRTYGSPDGGSIEDDPSLNCIVGFADGNCANVMALDGRGYGFSIFELDIFGKKGRIRITDGGQSVTLYQAETDSRFPNFNKLAQVTSRWETSTYGNAMVRAGQDILARALEPKTAGEINTLEEAIQDLRVIEAAMKSATNNHIEINVQ